MKKILFVCHGNICRSPMAEFVLKDMVNKKGIASQYEIASAATSREEIGNPVHYGTAKKLKEYGISTQGKYAIQMTKADYQYYDYVIAMESWNIKNIQRLIGEDKDHKVKRLLDYTDQPRDIDDPWYTGEFQKTYDDVLEGCEAFLRYLEIKEK